MLRGDFPPHLMIWDKPFGEALMEYTLIVVPTWFCWTVIVMFAIGAVLSLLSFWVQRQLRNKLVEYYEERLRIG